MNHRQAYNAMTAYLQRGTLEIRKYGVKSYQIAYRREPLDKYHNEIPRRAEKPLGVHRAGMASPYR